VTATEIIAYIFIALVIVGLATDRLSITSPTDRARKRNKADLQRVWGKGRR
jgi:hypothetical protein